MVWPTTPQNMRRVAIGSGERSPIAADGQLLAFAADPDSFRQTSIVQIAESATWAVPNAFGDSLLVKDVDTVALMRLHRTATPSLTRDHRANHRHRE